MTPEWTEVHHTPSDSYYESVLSWRNEVYGADCVRSSVVKRLLGITLWLSRRGPSPGCAEICVTRRRLDSEDIAEEAGYSTSGWTGVSREQRLALFGISVGMLSLFSLWLSAAAVGPSLEEEWGLTSGQVGGLTMAVMVGFVVASAGLSLWGRLRQIVSG